MANNYNHEHYVGICYEYWQAFHLIFTWKSIIVEIAIGDDFRMTFTFKKDAETLSPEMFVNWSGVPKSMSFPPEAKKKLLDWW